MIYRVDEDENYDHIQIIDYFCSAASAARDDEQEVPTRAWPLPVYFFLLGG